MSFKELIEKINLLKREKREIIPIHNM